jgi:hypothetical protein
MRSYSENKMVCVFKWWIYNNDKESKKLKRLDKMKEIYGIFIIWDNFNFEIYLSTNYILFNHFYILIINKYNL